MVWTFKIETQIQIPNTLIERGLRDGEHKLYRLTPNEGYVLHDAANDEIIIYPDTLEETKHLWYVSGDTTCGANYDFSPVTVTDENGVTFTAYGEREFFAKPKNEVKTETF